MRGKVSQKFLVIHFIEGETGAKNHRVFKAGSTLNHSTTFDRLRRVSEKLYFNVDLWGPLDFNRRCKQNLQICIGIVHCTVYTLFLFSKTLRQGLLLPSETSEIHITYVLPPNTFLNVLKFNHTFRLISTLKY